MQVTCWKVCGIGMRLYVDISLELGFWEAWRPVAAPDPPASATRVVVVAPDSCSPHLSCRRRRRLIE
jgi:hypothetical protein